MSSQDLDIAEEISEIQNGFELFDIDNKGLIDPNDLKDTMDEMNLKEKNPFVYDFITSLCSKREIKQKKGLTPDEFISYLQEKISDSESRDGIKRIFNVFADTNTDKVPMPSFYQTAREVGEIQSEQELRELIDKSHMGGKELDFNEFYDIMTENDNNKNYSRKKNYTYKNRINENKNNDNNNNDKIVRIRKEVVINDTNENQGRYRQKKEDKENNNTGKHYTYSRTVVKEKNDVNKQEVEGENNERKVRYYRRYRQANNNEGNNQEENTGSKVVSTTVVATTTTTTGTRYRRK